MARQNQRRRVDVLAAEAARALSEQRAAVVLSPADLDREAVVKRSDVDRAIAFFREANAGTEIAGLLDAPAGESEQDG